MGRDDVLVNEDCTRTLEDDFEEEEPLVATPILDGTSPWQKLMLPSLGNLLVGYNMSIMEWALKWVDVANNSEPTPSMHAVVLAGALSGCIVGMLLLGYIGDRIGRGKAMGLTLTTVLFGALGCSTFVVGDHMFMQLAIWRFVVGVGMGGIYPLSAVSAAEGTAEGDTLTKEVSVGLSFSTQMLGESVSLCQPRVF